MKAPTPEMEQRFSDWQRSLTLTDKRKQSPVDVTERQQALIDAVNAGASAFANHLQAELGLGDPGGIGAPELPRRLDPAEFRDPPLLLERGLYSAFGGQVTPAEASQPLFWTRCHFQWIASGQLGENLHGALLGTLTTGGQESTTEAATRNLLRRVGGLPHVRGKISVLNDCPISRAWWRGRVGMLAAERSEGSLDAEVAHQVLHSSNDAWSRLALHSVRRVTVINHSSIRAALVYHYREASRDTGGIPAAEFQDVIRLLARHGPALIFDALTWEELCELAARAIEEVRGESEPPDPGTSHSPPTPNPPATPTQQLTRFLRRLAN